MDRSMKIKSPQSVQGMFIQLNSRPLMPSSHFYVQSYGLLRFATVQVLRKTVGNRGVLGYV